jgi:hypothetical protein
MSVGVRPHRAQRSLERLHASGDSGYLTNPVLADL